MRAQHRDQDAVAVKLDTIDEGWCVHEKLLHSDPSPVPNHEVSRHDSNPLNTDATGTAKLDSELLRLLQERELEDVAEVLVKAGAKSLRRLKMMTEEDVARLGLPRLYARHLNALLSELKNL